MLMGRVDQQHLQCSNWQIPKFSAPLCLPMAPVRLRGTACLPLTPNGTGGHQLRPAATARYPLLPSGT